MASPRRTRRAAALLAAALGLVLATAAGAEPTRIEVRVISKGAKFVGTSMGGARVTVRDADTGELLATGRTAGSTGDTARIMTTARRRGEPLSTPDAAGFAVTLDLDAPRRLRFAAEGPLAQPQAGSAASATQWVVPGKDLTGGDGVLLELPGFAVDILSPATHSTVGAAPQQVRLSANVVMLCGCPLTSGGLWDADTFEVRARILHDGETVEVPLTYAGTASRFAADWTAPAPGLYDVTVYAWDPANGNTGVDRTTFIVGG